MAEAVGLTGFELGEPGSGRPRSRSDLHRRTPTELNGSCYRSRLGAQVCATLTHHPQAHRPLPAHTNGKIERYHRTLADEWAYARPYTTETERRAALDPSG